jgi:hypothetical protein
MRPPRKLLDPTGFLGRFVAAGAAALVLLLAVMSASPGLHAWAHGQSVSQMQKGHADQDCVVTQFSGGLTFLTTLLAVVALLGLIIGLVRPCAVVRLPVPRFWLPPLCGPPTA